MIQINNYYADKLSGEQLKRCYDLATVRVRQYLDAEITFVSERLKPDFRVLELGCGYGRVMKNVIPYARNIIGIDTAVGSLLYGKAWLSGITNAQLLAMNALDLGFPDGVFDAVVCIQNGISAFGVDREQLMREAVRVTRKGGRVLFSSYSERFWDARLEWFEIQSEQGLIGKIDHSLTKEGVIVGEDGFRARTFGGDDFSELCGAIGISPRITEVDGSSIFCEVIVP